MFNIGASLKKHLKSVFSAYTKSLSLNKLLNSASVTLISTCNAINEFTHKHWGSIYDVPSGGGRFISLLFSNLFSEYLFIFMCNGAEPNALLKSVSQTPSPQSKTTSTRRCRLNALLTVCLLNVTKLSAAGLEKGARQLNKKTRFSISAFEYLRVATFSWKANIYSSQMQRAS